MHSTFYNSLRVVLPEVLEGKKKEKAIFKQDKSLSQLRWKGNNAIICH